MEPNTATAIIIVDIENRHENSYEKLSAVITTNSVYAKSHVRHAILPLSRHP